MASSAEDASGKASDKTRVADQGTSPKGYFQESLAELRKITTPTRQEALQATLVTMLIIAFMSVCLFFLDFIFHKLIILLIG